jgi:hypothetical protein
MGNLNLFHGFPLYGLGINSIALPLLDAQNIARAATNQGFSVVGGEIYRLNNDGRPVYDGTSWTWPQGSHTPEAGLDAMDSFVSRCAHFSGQTWLESRYFDLDISAPPNDPLVETTAGVNIAPRLMTDEKVGLDLTLLSPVADTNINVSCGLDDWMSLARSIASPESFGGRQSILFDTGESDSFEGISFMMRSTRFPGQILVSAEGVRRDFPGCKYAGDVYFLIQDDSIRGIEKTMIEISRGGFGSSLELMGKWKLPSAIE